MKLIIKYIKKFILAAFLLYTYNMIAVNFNMIVPINIFTVSFISLFDIPALITLIIIKIWGV